MAFNTGFAFNVTIHANQSFLSIDISAKDNISEVNSSVETPKENGYPLEIHKFWRNKWRYCHAKIMLLNIYSTLSLRIKCLCLVKMHVFLNFITHYTAPSQTAPPVILICKIQKKQCISMLIRNARKMHWSEWANMGTYCKIKYHWPWNSLKINFHKIRLLKIVYPISVVEISDLSAMRE